MTEPPLSDKRYSTPVSLSFCTTPAASSGAMDVYSGRKSPSCFQWTKQITPATTASAAATIEMRCLRESPVIRVVIWSMAASAGYICIFMISW